jgi:hypothetical protein
MKSTSIRPRSPVVAGLAGDATVKEPNGIAPLLDNALGKLEQRRQKKKEYGVWRATSPQSEQEESGFMQRTTRRCDFFRKKLVVVRRKEAVLGRRLARTKMTLTIVGCSSTNLLYRLKVPFWPFASINYLVRRNSQSDHSARDRCFYSQFSLGLLGTVDHVWVRCVRSAGDVTACAYGSRPIDLQTTRSRRSSRPW